MSVHRISLSASEANTALAHAQQAREDQSPAAVKAAAVGSVTSRHRENTVRGSASSEELVTLGGIQMTMAQAEEMQLVKRNSDGSIGTDNELVHRAETEVQTREAEAEAETADLNETYAKADQALDYVTEQMGVDTVAAAGEHFIESGDLDQIAGVIPAEAVNDYVQGKIAWAEEAIEGIPGASVDLLQFLPDDLARMGRSYAVAGDAMGMQRVADAAVRGADTNEVLANALAEGGWSLSEQHGKFVVSTDQGVATLSTALRNGWLS